MKLLSRISVLCLITLVTSIGQLRAGIISPVFESFGSLPQATFGGSGIPSDAVAIRTINDGSNTITLGLTAHERTNGGFTATEVGNNGAGVFSAPKGDFEAESGVLGEAGRALWNFGFYVNVAGATLGDYQFDLLYDFDPSAGTDELDHGVIDLSAIIAANSASGGTTAEGSENLGFAYLASGIPGFVVPPTTSAFDPTAFGEYTFSLRASEIGGGVLGESAIQVNAVPEPSSIVLFGIGAGGMAFVMVRRRRKSLCLTA